jgi:uncharacterized surface protein with fasciclin (FAS1) repeats
MYNTVTQSKPIVVAAALFLAVAFSSTAVAGPGKPGNNEIAPGGNILDIAQAVNGATGEFEYLLTAVTECLNEDELNAVVALLTGEDKYTLFAPTDDAFKNLQQALGVPEGEEDPLTTCAVDEIFDEGTLFTVLAYHLTEGRRFSNSVFNTNNQKSIEMLTGDYIFTTPDLLIHDGAGQEIEVVPPFININASNGVIHVIDTVMLPFNPF